MVEDTPVQLGGQLKLQSTEGGATWRAVNVCGSAVAQLLAVSARSSGREPSSCMVLDAPMETDVVRVEVAAPATCATRRRPGACATAPASRAAGES